MKRSLKFILPIVAMILAVSLLAIPSFAEDNVVFISDEGAGTGDGSSAENALKATVGNFDASAASPHRQKDSVLYQAALKLKETGGTIVVCGPVRIDANNSVGTGAQTRDYWLEDHGENRITFTSVYNNVDYRETKNAAITIDNVANIVCRGDTTWENIKIITEGTGRFICGGFHSTIIGEGVICETANPENASNATFYIGIAGGERYLKKEGVDSNLVIKSGTFNKILGGNVGIGPTYDHIGNTNITIEGGTILGDVVGTAQHNTTPTTGNTTVKISGGTFKGSINAAGAGGYLNTDAQVMLIITGGDFSECLGINDIDVGNSNNAPGYSLLDYSGYTGNANDIFQCISYFDEIKAPEGFKPSDTTASDTTTAAPETTTAGGSDTTTEAPTTTTKADDTTKAGETTTKATDITDKGEGNNTVLIIVIIAAVVIAIIIVVVIVLKKKK